MSTIYFTINSFAYILLLHIVFFKQKGNKGYGSKIYHWLIDTTAIGVAFEFLNYFMISIIKIDPYSTAYLCSVRLVIMYYITWMLLFTLYIWVIAQPTDKQKKERFHKGITFVLV